MYETDEKTGGSMVGDICDFHCVVCGKYLFTEEEIPDETDPRSHLGKVIWKNYKKNCTYVGKLDAFVCDECLRSKGMEGDINEARV